MNVVCGVISDDDGRVLACRRPFGKHLGGLWEFPGGKVEAGESGAEALRRELLEELGVSVMVGAEFPKPVEWADEEVAISLRGFWCEISEGVPEAIEHEEIRWFEPAEMRELEWAEADLPFLEEILKR